MEALATFDGEVAVIRRKMNVPTTDRERIFPGCTENGLAGRVAEHVEDQGAVSASVAGVVIVNSMCSHNVNLGVDEGGEPFG